MGNHPTGGISTVIRATGTNFKNCLELICKKEDTETVDNVEEQNKDTETVDNEEEQNKACNYNNFFTWFICFLRALLGF